MKFSFQAINRASIFCKHWSLALSASLLLCTAQVQAQTNQQQPEPTWTLGADEIDVINLIKLVADATKRTILIDPAVKGKVRIMTNDNAMNADELYEVFRSVLELSNFTVIEVGDVIKVIPIKDARTSPVSSANANSGLSEIVTDVIPAENISAAKLLAALRPMVSTNANLSHHDGSNSIIITDNKANIDRIRRIIKKVDRAAVPTTELVALKYAPADALVETIGQLDQKDRAAAGLSSKLQIVADARNNAILLSGEDLQRDRVKKLIRLLDRPIQKTDAGNVRVIYLEYADAVSVAETLTRVVENLGRLNAGNTGTAPAQGSTATVEADEDTNALLITAEGDTMNSLLTVVERLDIRRAQVLVEAIIVELDVTNAKELGTEWLFLDESSGTVGAGPLGGPVAPALANSLIGSDASVEGIGTALAGLTGNTLGIAGGSAGGLQFLTLLRALNNSTKANILSTPSLLTMDNNEAEISVGQEVPFQTGSFTSNNGNVSNPFTTVQRESVGILLRVTPQINEGNKVLLNIEQEVSDVSDAAANGDIITNQNRIVTQVLAEDGEVVVLGGLIEEETRDVRNKVPVLGSIPLLGYFFKFQSTTVSKQNLVVFLRATIVRDDETMNAATAEKYQRIRDLQLESRRKGLPLSRDSNIPILPDVQFKHLDKDRAVKTDSDSGDSEVGTGE